MFHSAENHPLGQQPFKAGWRVRMAISKVPLMAILAAATAGLSVSGPAHAQMVPQPGHGLRQGTLQGDLTTVRINLNGQSSSATESRGKGLSLRGKGFWPQWEGRIGIVMDRPVDPLKDSFVLAQPAPSGLRLRSFHMLSDYYVEGGFRATAGLLRGDTGQAWWSSGDNGGGVNLSLQRLDNLGLLGTPRNGIDGPQTMPYVGAGFTSREGVWGLSSAWRFNADLGLISIGSSPLNNMSRALQGNKSLDELVRDLRLRPLVKVSVGYSF